MTTNNLRNDGARTEWWELISLTRPRDAYPHFLANKAEIEALLRAGHTMRRVWEAYRKASPPFPASYETFRTYCGKHGLSGLRRAAVSVSPPEAGKVAASLAAATPAPGPPALRPTASPTPKVWPRLPGKPREFIPRIADD